MLKFSMKGAVILKHHNVRSRLIDNTIMVIAANGLDKTTTKAIVKGTDINEAYIYSHFSDKEDLLSKTLTRWIRNLSLKRCSTFP